MAAQVSGAILSPGESAVVDEAATAADSSQRPTRSLRTNGLDQSRKLGRSRTPSELLARKQRLLNGAAGANASGAGGQSIAGSPDRARNDNRRPFSAQVSRSQESSEHLLSGSTTSTTSIANPTTSTSTSTSTSAESKLESLSQMLKQQNHTSIDLMNNDNEQQVSGAAQSSATLSSPSEPTPLASTAANHAIKSIDDVYILLAKKEKDLQLAAELGKALLERNDELSKTNERLAEEYSHKLEVSLKCLRL